MVAPRRQDLIAGPQSVDLDLDDGDWISPENNRNDDTIIEYLCDAPENNTSATKIQRSREQHECRILNVGMTKCSAACSELYLKDVISSSVARAIRNRLREQFFRLDALVPGFVFLPFVRPELLWKTNFMTISPHTC